MKKPAIRCIVSVIIAVAICAGISGCGPEQADGVYSAAVGNYEKIVDRLVEGNVDGAQNVSFFDTNGDGDILYRWSNMLVETNIWSDHSFPKEKKYFGYALRDLNNDGQEELILLLKDDTLLAILSKDGDKDILIDAFWPRYIGAVDDFGRIHTCASGGALYYEYSVSELNAKGDAMIPIERFICNGEEYTLEKDDTVKTLSESEKKMYIQTNMFFSKNGDREVTASAKLIFNPLG